MIERVSDKLLYQGVPRFLVVLLMMVLYIPLILLEALLKDPLSVFSKMLEASATVGTVIVATGLGGMYYAEFISHDKAESVVSLAVINFGIRINAVVIVLLVVIGIFTRVNKIVRRNK